MKKTTLLKFSDSSFGSWRPWRLGLLMFLTFLSSVLTYGQTGTIGIGSGTATNTNVPINSCYGYNYSQQIVKASDYAASGGAAGEITKLRFYFSGGVTTFTNWNNWTVYLGNTAKTSFASNTDWEPVANLTQVYSGVITPVAANWFEITFATPFMYNGTSNLVVAVDENIAGWNCTAAFGSYTGDANTAIYYYSDGTNPSPATPPSGTRTNTLARLQFVGTLAACVAPTGVMAAAAGTTTANISWTASATAPAGGYDYYYSTSATAPTSATVPSGSVGAGVLTAPLTGLTSNTTYYVWVRSNCGDSGVSSWSIVSQFLTPCDAVSVPYVQNFESVTTPALPECTTIQTIGTGASWITVSNAGAGFSSKSLRKPYSGVASNSWFFTRGLNLTGGVAYRLTYRYGSGSTFYTEKLKVSYGTANNAAAMTTDLANYATINSGAPVNAVVEFTPATTGTYYIGFNAYSAAFQDGLNLDDIGVIAVPTCDYPSGLTAAAAAFTSGNVSWTAPATAPANGYEYYYSTTNTAPTETTVASGNVAAGILTANITGLTANTTYYVWVRSVCSTTDKSTWSGPVTFFTGYCTPAPTSVDAQGIINVTMGTINNTSVAETGNYGNYSAQSTMAAAGSTVNFSITYATGYTYGTKIWVDWNNDTDFDDAGENVYTGESLATNPTVLSGSFVVPANASLVGSHRVRIGGTDSGPSTPCYSGAYGSYEDYTLEVFLPAAPVVTSFTPASYCAATGEITITGTSLGNATLTIGGTAVTTTSNTNTQIVATVPAGVSGVVSVTTVSGTSTSATTFTVTEPTPLVLSGTTATICAGASTPVVTIASGASAFDTYVWSPATGVTGNSATGYTFNPTETTTYTLTASQSVGGCVIEIDYTVTVNPLPQPVTITASSTDVCLNQVVTLTGNGGLSALPSAYCSPTVASTGATGDYLNNFTFANITNNNSGDAVSDYTYYSALTANVTAGTAYTLTLQSGPTFSQGYRVWIDYNQDGVFTAAESVFVSTTYTTTVQTATVTVPTTAFNGVTRMRVLARYSNVPAAGDFCTSPGYGEYEDYKVNITGATNSVNYIWSPVAGLYSDAAATTAYTGQSLSVVYAKVTEDVTYTATATSNLGCSASAETELSVIITPAPVVETTQTVCEGSTISSILGTSQTLSAYSAATGGTALTATTIITPGTYYIAQILNGCESVLRTAVTVSVNVVPAPVVTPNVVTFCNAGTVANLTASGTGIKWYAAATGGTELAATTAFTEGITVYYASQTINGCESTARAAIAVELNITDAPAAVDLQAFCNTGTVAELSANGQGIMWYAAATGGTALTANALLVNNTVYYASQTINGCESTQRTAVTAVINTPAAPVADAAAQTFCNAGTVAGLMVTGEGVQWYADATGGMALTAGTMLMDGMVYYASQTINGCESVVRTAVTATVNTTAAPVADDLLAFCYTATVADLTAEGENLQWYTDVTGGTALTAETVVADNLYYVSQTVNGCESVRTPVFVIVDVVSAPQGETTQTIEVTQGDIATVGDITVNGVSVVWYATEADALAGTNPLTDATTIISGNTYYAIQTIGECSSATPLAVTVTTTLGGKEFDVRSFTYYPNPVKNVLTVSYSSDITSVAVFNLLGQEVMVKSINATQGNIDMSNLADGTYMVNVTSGNMVKTIKVIKKQ